MSVLVKAKRYSGVSDEVSDRPERLSEVIAGALIGEDYDRGALEEAQAAADNAAAALGRLMEVLYARGIITHDEIISIVDTIKLESFEPLLDSRLRGNDGA